MFRNILCEAEPDEPGERSPFGAIRTGIELCERQPRQSSGSIGQPDLAPDAMPDTVLIVPAAGMRRIVAQRADIEMLEFSFPRRIRRLWASRSYWHHGNRTDGCGSHPASAAGSSNRKNPVPASYENPLRTAQDDDRMPISTLSGPTVLDSNSVSESESRTVPSNDS